METTGAFFCCWLATCLCLPAAEALYGRPNAADADFVPEAGPSVFLQLLLEPVDHALTGKQSIGDADAVLHEHNR